MMNSTERKLLTDKATTQDIEQSMNAQIYNRNIPSGSLQPYINARPVSTKYSIMPIVDPRKKVQVPMRVDPTYNISQTFNPGNNTAPWSGYASQVNTESELKNQVFALQHCDQRAYVPQSNSDLYEYSFNNVRQVQQQHPLLFDQQTFSACQSLPPNVHTRLFHNQTREDARESMLQ